MSIENLKDWTLTSEDIKESLRYAEKISNLASHLSGVTGFVSSFQKIYHFLFGEEESKLDKFIRTYWEKYKRLQLEENVKSLANKVEDIRINFNNLNNRLYTYNESPSETLLISINLLYNAIFVKSNELLNDLEGIGINGHSAYLTLLPLMASIYKAGIELKFESPMNLIALIERGKNQLNSLRVKYKDYYDGKIKNWTHFFQQGNYCTCSYVILDNEKNPQVKRCHSYYVDPYSPFLKCPKTDEIFKLHLREEFDTHKSWMNSEFEKISKELEDEIKMIEKLNVTKQTIKKMMPPSFFQNNRR